MMEIVLEKYYIILDVESTRTEIEVAFMRTQGLIDFHCPLLRAAEVHLHLHDLSYNEHESYCQKTLLIEEKEKQEEKLEVDGEK